MNRKTIDQINAELDNLHKKLSKTVRKIDELRDLRKKIRRGIVKQPPPKGTVHKIGAEPPNDFYSDRLDDISPVGFGSGASGMGVG